MGEWWVNRCNDLYLTLGKYEKFGRGDSISLVTGYNIYSHSKSIKEVYSVNGVWKFPQYSVHSDFPWYNLTTPIERTHISANLGTCLRVSALGRFTSTQSMYDICNFINICVILCSHCMSFPFLWRLWVW